MQLFGQDHCPKCMSAISAERANSVPKVCNTCGHVVSDSENRARRQNELRSLRWVVGMAAFILLVFIQVSSWGARSIEVLPLQISEWLGMTSAEGSERMAAICLETKKYDCVEKHYAVVAVRDPNQLARLGKFQFNRQKYTEASQSLQSYFIRGGTPDNIEVRYVLARAMGETGRVDEASVHYNAILAAKPDVLQVTVAQNYVKLLVQNGRLEQALKVIDSIRSRGDSVAQFMDGEYRDISRKLGRSSS